MIKRIVISLLMLLMVQSSLQAGTVPTQENVTKLYVATFNRAPDAAGLNYWVNNSGLDLERIAQSFFDQPETQEAYPPSSTNEDFVIAVYDNLFNRTPDGAGLDYWVAELDSGRIAKSVFILAVINGAQNTEEFGNDATILDNKTIVGLDFANAGLDDVEDARDIMDGITDDYNTVYIALLAYDIDYFLSSLYAEAAVDCNEVDFEGACTEYVYYESGALKFESLYVNGIIVGTSKGYYENGALREEIPYVNGVKHGIYRFYGYYNSEIPYVNGVMHGIGKSYYPSGAIYSETPYVDGVIDGIHKFYQENGEMLAVKPYVNGVKHGTEKAYDLEGLAYEVTWVNGLRQGDEIRYWSSTGQIHIIYPYVDDVIHGTGYQYDINGNLVSTFVYIDGEYQGSVYN